MLKWNVLSKSSAIAIESWFIIRCSWSQNKRLPFVQFYIKTRSVYHIEKRQLYKRQTKTTTTTTIVRHSTFIFHLHLKWRNIALVRWAKRHQNKKRQSLKRYSEIEDGENTHTGEYRKVDAKVINSLNLTWIPVRFAHRSAFLLILALCRN